VTVIGGGWMIDGLPVERLTLVLSSSSPPANKIIIVPLGCCRLYHH
jgi:hypothetical protein